LPLTIPAPLSYGRWHFIFVCSHHNRAPITEVHVETLAMREKGDFNKKSKFLNVHQRKNLIQVHSAWEPVDDQSKRQLQ
jgi:hypothetical protein